MSRFMAVRTASSAFAPISIAARGANAEDAVRTHIHRRQGISRATADGIRVRQVEFLLPDTRLVVMADQQELS